jgi:hypothetical protein
MALLTRNHRSKLQRTLQRIGAAGALVMALCILAVRADAQKAASIDDVKAAFVYQFANFITWPDDAFTDPAQPVTIGILGNETVANVLRESVRDKRIGDRQIVVRELTTPQEALECQIVFLDPSDDARVDAYLAVLVGKAILTVSDDNNFTEEGGIIKLYEQQNKLRIEINVDEAARSNLTVSSKLLSLAKVVRDRA